MFVHSETARAEAIVSNLDDQALLWVNRALCTALQPGALIQVASVADGLAHQVDVASKQQRLIGLPVDPG